MNASPMVSKVLVAVVIFGILCLSGTQASATLPASVAITASPGTICAGQSARLTWSSTDATSIVIDQGIGSVLPYGDRDVFPTQTTTYTITGTNGAGGYATATATVYVTGSCTTPTPTWTPSPALRCEPSRVYANSGDYVTFTAYYDYDSQQWPRRQLTWSAVGGHPSSGTGWSFGTRFYTDSISEIRTVRVSDGHRSATCTVHVSGNTPTPYPSSLRCSADASVIDSGERVTFTARGGTGNYSWYAYGGFPSSGDDSTFRTRFTNYEWYDQYHTVTVTSGWQTATCAVWVRGTRPMPYPTWTPYPTWHPTPTVYPYPEAALSVSAVGRNVSRGQTGEYGRVTAQVGDTLDLIVRVRALNGRSVNNGIVTVSLPSGFTYLPGSTTVNGYVVSDGVAGSGINVGTVDSATHTTVKFSVRVDSSAIPRWGTVTVNSTARARGDGAKMVSATLPITLGTGTSIAAVSAVKTGPADTALLALFIALLATGAYAAYTRTDLFGRRAALAEVARLSRSSDLNFSR